MSIFSSSNSPHGSKPRKQSKEDTHDMRLAEQVMEEYREHKYSMGLWDVIRHYSAWTSINGLPHIVLTHSRFLRFLWLVITLVAFSAGLYQLVTLTMTFLEYPVAVETQRIFGPVQFPKVTVCNVNPWKGTGLQGTPLEELVFAYNQMSPSRRYGFGYGPAEGSARALRATQWTWLIGEQLVNDVEEKRKRKKHGIGWGPAYSPEELLISCHFNGSPCNRSSLGFTVDAQRGGFCLTFNADGRARSTVPGPIRGLKLLLRADNNDYLSWTLGQGFRISIGHPRSSSHSKSVIGHSIFGGAEDGEHFAPVGRATLFAVDRIVRRKLPLPFNNCTSSPSEQREGENGNHGGNGGEVQQQHSTGENQHRHQIDQRQEHGECLRECLQKVIVQRCRCLAPLSTTTAIKSNGRKHNKNAKKAVAAFGDVPPCSNVTDPNRALDCVLSVLSYSYNESSAAQSNPFASCRQCRQSCDQSHFRVVASEGKWPAKTHNPPECAFDKKNTNNGSIRWRSREECLRWYSENTAMVMVFHRALVTTSYIETQEYEMIEFIADAGGALGLWLGMSLISFVEVVIFVCIVIGYLCARVRPERLAKGEDAGGVHYFGQITDEAIRELDQYRHRESNLLSNGNNNNNNNSEVEHEIVRRTSSEILKKY